MKIRTVYELKLKDLIMHFSFQWSIKKIIDQKTLFCIFSPNFIVVLCSNFIKKFQISIFFIILTIFLQNKCKIGDLLPIFFVAFFVSFSLQRIFFAKIFFVCKDSKLLCDLILLIFGFPIHGKFLVPKYANCDGVL